MCGLGTADSQMSPCGTSAEMEQAAVAAQPSPKGCISFYMPPPETDGTTYYSATANPVPLLP